MISLFGDKFIVTSSLFFWVTTSLWRVNRVTTSLCRWQSLWRVHRVTTSPCDEFTGSHAFQCVPGTV